MSLESQIKSACSEWGLENTIEAEGFDVKGVIPVTIGDKSYGLEVVISFPIHFPNVRPTGRAKLPLSLKMCNTNVISPLTKFVDGGFGEINGSSTPSSVISNLVMSLKAQPPFLPDAAERNLRPYTGQQPQYASSPSDPPK
jgi:hypothetical protein